ncbi:cyclin-dependent kinase inhibitor 7 isoform X2 [Punica granatum]|uniref:Cyclin-dependent kinase inhibitor 7 isoform X2 n=1 Tax=Punica granatum TaxID=22663 RepID=A0A6P8DA63_PUNGR|nr:cyclin-dependent kinase inhibitor 7 isoform X2 [Punica granatum]
MEEDSSRTRECKRTSVTYSSSSSSTAPSKRRKVSSPLGGDGDWDRDWEAFSSVSELASCTALLSTGSAGKAKVEVISPAAALLLRSGRLCPSSFCSDVPAVSPPPLSSFGSGEVVEQRFLVGDQLEEEEEEEEEKSLGTETSSATTCAINGYFSSRSNTRETTPPSHGVGEEKEDSRRRLMEQVERSPTGSNDRRSAVAGRGRTMMPMPPQAEIEEFFSAAEKYEQKRFTEKYNYDVVKDVPLEGQYQWVRLKP